MEHSEQVDNVRNTTATDHDTNTTEVSVHDESIPDIEQVIYLSFVYFHALF